MTDNFCLQRSDAAKEVNAGPSARRFHRKARDIQSFHSSAEDNHVIPSQHRQCETLGFCFATWQSGVFQGPMLHSLKDVGE